MDIYWGLHGCDAALFAPSPLQPLMCYHSTEHSGRAIKQMWHLAVSKVGFFRPIAIVDVGTRLVGREE